MGPSSKFVSRSEKGVKHSKLHPWPESWDPLPALAQSLLPVDSIHLWVPARSSGAAGCSAHCPQLLFLIHGLFILCLTRLLHITSCYLLLVSTVTFSPLVLPYLGRTLGLH